MAGYINYSDNNLGIDSAWNKDDTEDAAQTASDTGIVEEIESLDYDLTDETALLEENNKAAETGEARKKRDRIQPRLRERQQRQRLREKQC